jgi:hypothetical protein
MSWPFYLPIITVCDVLDSGACHAGVVEFVEANGMQINGLTVNYLNNEYIVLASCANGDGYGCGYGCGDGYGYGDGCGYGYGYGD